MIVATGAAKTRVPRSATRPSSTRGADYDALSALVDSAEARATQRAANSANGETVSGDEDVHVGPIASDDAYYAETDDAVDDWEAAGLLAVEMEAAAVFSLARRKGLAAGAICTVDGNLVEGTQKGTDTGTTNCRTKPRTTSGAR